MPTFSTVRAAVVLGLIGMCMCILTARVAYLQTYGRQQTINSAERQQHQTNSLKARRGTIFDCNGIMMAGSVQTRTLYMDPTYMVQEFSVENQKHGNLRQAIEKLSKVLEKDPAALLDQIAEGAEIRKRFIKLVENVDVTTEDEVAKLAIPGVGFLPAATRVYPMGSLAAHVLGGVGKEGTGLEGIELKFDRALAGHDGFERVVKDARRRPIALCAENYMPPQHGQHLVLTIDSNIQMIAEQELAAACEKYKGKRGEVVVMDPHTGDVLALANYPTFNPQNLNDSPQEVRRNNCLVAPYEPGSTFKPFLAGPARSWRLIRLEERWPIPGISWRTPYGRRVTDVHGYGPLATWDVLVKSSNIGACMIAERMGNPRIHHGLVAFGFGKPTAVELPGETGGKLLPLPKWTKYSTESVAQGYEIMVTPLQLARAFSVYANGGKLVQPRIVKGMLDDTGNTIARRQTQDLRTCPQVLDPTAAVEIRRVLSDVPVRGTARGARSRVWNIFGKTGTAHISMGRSGYSPDKFNSSFIAGAPSENPRLIIAMVVHEADRKIAHYGGTVTAPSAARALERSLAYLQVPPSPDLPPPPPQIANVLVNYDAKCYSNRSVGAMAARE